jgi:putative FmdB family regulatory protein
MPMFSFSCDDCDDTFEKLVFRISDTDKVTCDSCGSSNVHKLMSRVAKTKVTGGSSASYSSSANCAPSGGG